MQLNLLERFLIGTDNAGDYDEYKERKTHKAFFPLIDKEAAEGFYGILESITVSVNKSSAGDKFILVPSEREIEKKILEQTKTSWYAALNLSKAYIKKPYKFHEVIISFDKKDGFYIGSSLGIALTVSFLEQLLKFYNPTYFIKIKEQTAFTGGITEDGSVLSCGDEIIKQKVKAVFFSEVNSFIVAKDDEIPAREQLLELQKDYPQRNLKIIPVEDINDVLNRRDVVDIRKQKLVVRTGRFVRKNKLIFTLFTVVLAIIFWGSKIKLSNNPTSYTVKGRTISVFNKYSQLLLEILTNNEYRKSNAAGKAMDFLDTDGDGINEIFWGDSFNEEGKIYLANTRLDTIWQFGLNRQINFPENPVGSVFNFYKLKIAYWKESQKPNLFVIASSPQFASCIIHLDPQTKTEKDILLNAGHILDLEFVDLNADGINEMLIAGISNDWESGFFAVLNEKNLNGQIPVRQNKYRSSSLDIIKNVSLILFPPTELGRNIVHDHKWASILAISVKKESKTIKLEIQDGSLNGHALNFYVILDYNLNILNFFTSSYYDIIAEELFRKGKINFKIDHHYFNSYYFNQITRMQN